jgi:hypothetical protein
MDEVIGNLLDPHFGFPCDLRQMVPEFPEIKECAHVHTSYVDRSCLSRDPRNYLPLGDSRNVLRRAVNASASRVSHSQITQISQPAALSFFKFALSRLRLYALFESQYSLFVSGMPLPFLHECACQKQPWTKITFRCFFRTKSGRPGSLLSWSL